jgi:hypothetical protein
MNSTTAFILSPSLACAGSLIEAKRFVLSLGRFGKALGPKDLVGEMRAEIQAMRKDYGAV